MSLASGTALLRARWNRCLQIPPFMALGVAERKWGEMAKTMAVAERVFPSSPFPALTFPHAPAFYGFIEVPQVRIDHLLSSPSLVQCIFNPTVPGGRSCCSYLSDKETSQEVKQFAHVIAKKSVVALGFIQTGISDLRAYGVDTKSTFLKPRCLQWQLLCGTRASGAILGASTLRALDVAVSAPRLPHSPQEG